MNGENQAAQDQEDQERRRELENDRLEQTNKQTSGQADDQNSEDESELKGDAGGQGKANQSGGLAGAASSLASGKLLKGKGRLMQFLIVSGAIIGSFFGLGLTALSKCFKEEPLFAGIVIVFWLMAAIAIFISAVLLIIYGVCNVPGIKALASVYAFLTGGPNICSKF